MNGDGAKQFYFIQKFNVGLADNYTAGTISIKDLEVIKIRDIFPEGTPIVQSNGLSKRVVGADGCIENFNNYNIYTEMYYYWEQSSVNKDEAMKLDNIHKIGEGWVAEETLGIALYCALRHKDDFFRHDRFLYLISQ